MERREGNFIPREVRAVFRQLFYSSKKKTKIIIIGGKYRICTAGGVKTGGKFFIALRVGSTTEERRI